MKAKWIITVLLLVSVIAIGVTYMNSGDHTTARNDDNVESTVGFDADLEEIANTNPELAPYFGM